MKAAILPDFGQPLRIEDVPTPVPGADEVLIQVEACGVCHSDLHIAHGDLAGFRAATKERVIPGHEVIGKVVAKGADVAHLAIGDRVGVAWLHWACGVCEQCREGLENLCRKGIVTGMMVDGGYAEFMRAKASHALKIPEALDSAEAAPLFCARSRSIARSATRVSARASASRCSASVASATSRCRSRGRSAPT